MTISKVKVNGKINDGFRTEIGCSHNFVIDQPKAMGGNDEGANPMEVFLSSIPACICAIGRIISNQRRLNVRGISVDVEGSIDKDFLMGKTEEGRAGFTEIITNVKVDADMTQEEKEAFVEEIEKRCPIADNIVSESNLKTNVN